MPAVSQKQQRFFGYLKSHPLEAAARGIKPQVVDEFAQTDVKVAKLPLVAPQRKAKVPKWGRLSP